MVRENALGGSSFLQLPDRCVVAEGKPSFRTSLSFPLLTRESTVMADTSRNRADVAYQAALNLEHVDVRHRLRRILTVKARKPHKYDHHTHDLVDHISAARDLDRRGRPADVTGIYRKVTPPGIRL